MIKKSDRPEAYLYRDEANEICLPASYVKGSIINAARFKQDPRSPRKSAMDLFKAAIVPLFELASLGIEEYDYEHQTRVTVQRSAVTRIRPAIKAGWKATFQFLVTLPEYVSPALLQEVLVQAGRVVGVADFRPTYGRFSVTRFEVIDLGD